VTPVPAGALSSPTPSRNANATGCCLVCGESFVLAPNKVYCGAACKAKAWRRRHQTPTTPVAVPAAQPRRHFTVYECPTCETRALGLQRCECGSFMRRVGYGGLCPHCDAPVAVEDLLEEVMHQR
jgi:hypothetical protein